MRGNYSNRSLARNRQQGAIIVFAALGISLAVIMLSIADIGFMYYYKRDYQKAADLAAMAGAKHLIAADGTRSCTDNATPAAQSNAAQNLGGQTYNTPISVTCGKWSASTTPHLDTSASEDEIDAVQVVISGTPPRFLPFVGLTVIAAHSTAIADQPVAALNIRSSLANIDTSKSELLNSVVGGMLGGSLALAPVSWNGLLNANVNLLNYLDSLAIRLGVSAGDYDAVLNTETNVGTLLGAAVDALGNGSTAGLAINSIIGSIGANVGAINSLTLGQVLALQAGVPHAGVDLAVNAFDLAQAFVQLANSASAVKASVPVNLLGLLSATVTIKVIEPPQLSAVGNPALAAADPRGPHQIYVRTAQVRVYVTVNLPALGGITGLANAVTNLLAPVTTLLNNLLSLNLVATLNGLVGSLVGIPYELTDIQLLPGAPRIDISLDVASGDARVTDYNCPTSGITKSLTVQARTAAVNLRLGQMNPSEVFSSTEKPVVSPLPLIDIGSKTCRVFLLIISSCDARKPFANGGVGIMVDTDVAGTTVNHQYDDPPLITEDPLYYGFSTQNVVNSLSSTLSGVQLQVYQPSKPGMSGGLGGVLTGIGSILDGVTSILRPIITSVLSPLLDPLVNTLLQALGIDLAKTEVGARLTCEGSGASLVD